MRRGFTTALPLLCLGAAVFSRHCPAQVFINELLENPPGSGEAERLWEFIELYGEPGYELDGYRLLVLKGGVDDDRNGVPESAPEIDAAFVLDGYALDRDGFFVLVNCDERARSELAIRYLERDHSYDRAVAEGPGNSRWHGAGTFASTMLSAPNGVGRLDHDGSTTLLLIYEGWGDASEAGRAEGWPFGRIRDGVCHDANFDGRIDSELEANGERLKLGPLQIADSIAWSNRGGREYALSDDHELSETHGFNPDALSRVRFFAMNPRAGHRTKDKHDAAGRVIGFKVLPTTTADESYVYGALDTSLFPERLEYTDGFSLEGWKLFKAPTDPEAPRAASGPLDPEPDEDSFPPPYRSAGPSGLAVRDLRLPGFVLTPGAPNDHPGGLISQQRLTRGDLDFDGVIGENDLAIGRALLGAGLSDMLTHPGDPTYRHQGISFQQVLMLSRLAPPYDGVVSELDLRALKARAAQEPGP